MSAATDRAAGRRMILAQLEGQQAARNGQPATACPYAPSAEDAVTRARARMWLRGYDRVNPLTVDYSG